MPVVDVGEMRMAVGQRHMLVLMRVRFLAVPREGVPMLMVGIVRMAVSVRERLMSMLVVVLLGQVQPYAPCHERGSHPEGGRGRLVKRRDRHGGADEGGRGEVRARSG